MGLNISKGNMYDWITHTFNIIKGSCYHDCTYCYMKRWGKLNKVRFDEKELKTDLGKGNFIFVGSSTDMFADDIPKEWIESVLRYCRENPKNRYLYQTKNPQRLIEFILPKKSVVCVTLETNRHYESIMRNSPTPSQRVEVLSRIKLPKYLTVEPILDFDLKTFVNDIKNINPIQVNIGSDSGGNNLPEPSKAKVLRLITELEKFTKVKQKSNLKRLLI